MRASEFLPEGLLPSNQADPMPATFVLPGLKSQDPYTQYRFGVTMASARARANNEVAAYENESNFGEDMVVVCRSPEEEETLKMALSDYGKNNQSNQISTSTSREPPATNKQSPVLGNTRKYGKNS